MNDGQSQSIPERNHNQPVFESGIVADVGNPNRNYDASDGSDMGGEKNGHNLNIHKMIVRSESRESANNYNPKESSLENKIQNKQSVESYDAEPSSLTIHNDIARRPLQKQQNDNISIKLKNSYDKKLNQPTAKPSVSNVFSSLNEYINASGARLENVDVKAIRKDSSDEVQEEDEAGKTNDATKVAITSNDCSNNLPQNVDEGTGVRKISNTIRPEYQNILLPVKLEANVSEMESKDSSGIKLEESISLLENLREIDKEPLYTNTTLPAVVDRPKESKSIIDRPEHVYENVYIGTDIPKSQELYATVNKGKPKVQELKSQDQVKHTYENVDFDEPKKITKTDGKENVYECIYIGNRENFPETTTELEIAAKKIADQLHVSEKSNDMESKGINLAKLVFQTVQLGATETENKPVGFSHIDDLSEEELNKYLADLEAEERAQEATTSYGNSMPSSYRDSDALVKSKFQNLRDDEDANEAPIFESVTIGELPEVSRVELLEKAKKFPVIDYSKSGPSGEQTGDFLVRKGSEKFPEPAKVISEAREEKGKERKSKKTNEKMRKTSDNSEPNIENVKTQDDDLKPMENDETNGTEAESTKSISSAHESPSSMETLAQGEPGTTESDKSGQESKPEYSIGDTNPDHSLARASETSVNIESNGINSVPNCTMGDPNVASNDPVVIEENGTPVPNIEQSSDNDGQPQSDNLSSGTENGDANSENDPDTERPPRPLTLNIVSTVNMEEQNHAGEYYSLLTQIMIFIVFYKSHTCNIFPYLFTTI